MADAFAHVRTRAEEASRAGGRDQSPLLRERTAQQRQALGLFLRMKVATRNDEAIFFKLPSRQAYLLRARWLGEGFFEVANASTKGRSYRLANRLSGWCKLTPLDRTRPVARDDRVKQRGSS